MSNFLLRPRGWRPAVVAPEMSNFLLNTAGLEALRR
jgi:hypothetical protein